ncbi:MAG TPA: glycosyl hydrolase [Leucothrix sp.]|nr:glycosyl hydrolase [Leucothrix sp.]
MSINLDKNPDETRALIDDLGVNNLLIRVPLHDIENIKKYVAFAEQFKDKNLLINILQDRRHVEDLGLAKQSIQQIFEQFSHLTHRFQIANAINRKKWSIFSMDEYLQFFKVAYDLKQNRYPKLILLGASVIDFEYYFMARTLFNIKKIRFDQCSSLLYVDRRGAPENTQMGLDLQSKLLFLQAMLRLSPKIKSPEIVITETNWPITKTAPYAPTSENDCVSLDDHASFLVRYYLLALATGVVKNVYWHQLIAPGYGLIDNREGKIIKYPAYQSFQVMLSLLQGAKFLDLKESVGLYRATFKKSNELIEVLWSLEKTKVSTENKTVMLRNGERYSKDRQNIYVGSSPIYLVSEYKS